ncbi:MAG: recombinase RecT [Gemmatimonadota bacterium]
MYVIFDLPSGLTRFHWMSRQEVDEVKASSRASSSGPWVDWYGQMAIKTCIKRGLKTLPSDPTASNRLAMALEADNRFETGTIGMPVPEWDDEGDVASAATQARKERLKAELLELRKKQEGHQVGETEEEPDDDGSSDDGESAYERLRRRYFAMAGEVFEDDDARKAWQEAHLEKASAGKWATEDYRKAIEMLEHGIGLEAEAGSEEPDAGPDPEERGEGTTPPAEATTEDPPEELWGDGGPGGGMPV